MDISATDEHKQTTALLELTRMALWEVPPHELCTQAVNVLFDYLEQYETAGVRILADGQEYFSRHYEQTPWEFSAEIRSDAKLTGRLTVCKIAEPADRAFSEEQKELVSETAAVLGKAFEREATLSHLQDAREYADRIVESVREPMLVLDEHLKVIRSNKAFAETYGISSEQTCGRHLSEIGGGQFDISELRHLLTLFAAGTISLEDYELEHDWHQTRRNLLLNARWVTHPKYDGRILLTIDDITERKRKMQLLSGIIENSETPVYVKDTEGRYLLANRYYENVLVGWKIEEIIGKTVFDLFPEEIAAELREHEKKVIESGEVLKLEEVAIDKYGNYHTYMSVKFPLLDSEGTPYAVAGIATEITEQKETEAILERQRYEYETIFNSMPAWIWYKDRNSVVVRANKAACESAGLSAEEIIGKTTQELYPETADGYTADDREVMETGEPKLGIVEQIRLPSGELGWARTDKIPYRDSEGNVIGIIAVSVDMTELKRAQDELQHQQREYETIFNSVPTMIWYKDQNSIVVRANKAAAKAADKTVDEVIGQPTHVLYPAEGAKYEAEDQEVMRTGEPLIGLIDPFTRKDGTQGWIRADKVPYCDENENVIGVIVFAVDITDHIRAEKALRESQQQLQAILDNTTAMIYVKDRDGRYLVANNALLQQYNVEEEEVIGEFDHHIFPAELAETYRKNDQLVLDTGKPRTFEEEYRSAGNVRVHLASKVPLRDANDNVYAVCSISTDITEKKRKEHLLQEFAENVVERVPALVVTFDRDMRIQRLNKYTEEIIGYSRDEVQTTEWLKNFTLARERDDIIASIRKILDGETTVGRENTVIDKQGNQLVVRWYGTPLRDEQNNVAGALVMGVDITEIRRKERQLESARQEAEADRRRLQTVLEALPLGVLMADADGTVVEANKTMADIVGLPGLTLPTDSADYAPLEAWWTATGEPVTQDEWPIYRAMQDGDVVSQAEIDFIGFDGIRRTVLVSGAPVRDPDGEIIGGVAIALDITERKQIAKELEHRTALLSALLDSIPDLVFFKDPDGVYLGCNPAFTEFAGRPREAIIGRTDYDFFNKQEAEHFRHNDRLMLEQESPRSNEEWITLADGKRVLVDTLKAPLRDQSGNIIGLVGVSRDITQRKEAEDELRDSRSKLAEAQQIAHVGSWEWRIPANQLNWSEETYRILGHSPNDEDLTYQSYLDHVHPEDLDHVKAAVEQTVLQGVPLEIEHRFVLPDGSERTVYVRGQLTRNEQARPVRLAGTVQDITERKEAEQKLRASQARLQEAQQIAHIGSWEWIVKTGKLQWSEETYRIFGRSPEDFELNYESYLGAIHPDDVSRVKNIIENAMYGKSVFDMEHRVILPDGSERTVYCQGKVSYDGNKTAVRMAGTIQDITKRKEAERKLRASQARLQEAQQIAHIGSWEWIIPTGELHWSDESYRIYGFSPAEFTPSYGAYLQRVHPDDREKTTQAIEQTLWHDVPYEVEHRILLPDGAERTVYGRGELTRDEQGNPVRLAGTVQDITERKRLQAQLSQAAKMEAIGRLAGGVAHDFNNYLTAIRGYTTLMSLDLPPESDLQEDLNEVVKATNHAAQLTMQLLAFGRRAVLKPEPLNINHVLDSMASSLRRVLREDVYLHIHQESGLPAIYADPGQIQQVILNLIINARDAMPSGGELTLITHKTAVYAEKAARYPDVEPGDYVQMIVNDTGTGIDEETLEHIFEPFFTTKVTGEGTGLGLATVHGIVTQSGGFIEVESTVGEGTTFTVYFPAVEAEEVIAEAAEEEETCVGGQETVLVVEDEEAVRSFVVKILQKYNFTVLEARDPKEAIEISAQYEGNIDLLVSDVIMPEMNGLELAAKLKAERPDMPALFISGYTKDAIPDRNIAESDIDLLTKPFTIEELCSRIRHVLDAVGK